MTYYFDCQQWFSRDEQDGLLERDLHPGQQAADNPDVQYSAEIHTSDMRGAGTDADVSLELFGLLGSSGTHRLNASLYATSDTHQSSVSAKHSLTPLLLLHEHAVPCFAQCTDLYHRFAENCVLCRALLNC